MTRGYSQFSGGPELDCPISALNSWRCKCSWTFSCAPRIVPGMVGICRYGAYKRLFCELCKKNRLRLKMGYYTSTPKMTQLLYRKWWWTDGYHIFRPTNRSKKSKCLLKLYKPTHRKLLWNGFHVSGAWAQNPPQFCRYVALLETHLEPTTVDSGSHYYSTLQ